MAARKKKGKSRDIPKLEKKVKGKIKPASKMPKRFRALIYGRSGAGKTRLASTAPNVLLIDVNEQGTDSVRRDYDPDVYPVEFWTDLDDAYWYLAQGDHSYESVAIDGITGMQNLCMKFVLGDEASRDASRDPDMPSRAVWGKVGELMKTQITNFRNLPMNVIFTALQRKMVTGDEDDETEEVFYSPACSPSISGHLEAAVGMIGYLHTAEVLAKKQEGQKKRARTTRTRLIVGASDRYLTKDRYHIGAPHVDAPNVTELLELIYGKKEA
jgi:hypothetical protein